MLSRVFRRQPGDWPEACGPSRRHFTTNTMATFLAADLTPPCRNQKRSSPPILISAVVEPVASPPHGLDMVFAACRLCQLFAQIADQNIDDLELWFVHPAIEMVEKHLLGYDRIFAQAEQLEDAVFLACQWHRLVMY